MKSEIALGGRGSRIVLLRAFWGGDDHGVIVIGPGDSSGHNFFLKKNVARFCDEGYERIGLSTHLMKSAGIWGAGLAVVLLLASAKLQGQVALHLQHDDGRVGVWKLDGLHLRASLEYEPPRPPEGFALVGAGDFNGDGKPDLLFESGAGDPVVWHMDRELRIGSRELDRLPVGERVALVVDWDDDGLADLLTRDGFGAVAVRSRNARGKWQAAAVLALIPDAWRLIGTGDFDGNGERDLLLERAGLGVEAWLFVEGEKSLVVSWIENDQMPEGWSAVGSTDFDGDGIQDVALQNGDGSFAFWPGTATEATLLEEAPSDSGWQVVAVSAGEANDRGSDDVSEPAGEGGDGSAGAAPSEPSGSPPSGDPAVRKIVSAGDPDAQVSDFIEEWRALNGGPYLEVWVLETF